MTPRALVIDDERPVRELFRDVLASLGIDADIAAGGEEGLAMFETTRHRLVLLDYLMPGLDGLRTAKLIRKLSPGTALLLLTGGGCEDEIRDEGFTVLGKPVDLAEFKRTIGTLVGAAPGSATRR